MWQAARGGELGRRPPIGKFASRRASPPSRPNGALTGTGRKLTDYADHTILAVIATAIDVARRNPKVNRRHRTTIPAWCILDFEGPIGASCGVHTAYLRPADHATRPEIRSLAGHLLRYSRSRSDVSSKRRLGQGLGGCICLAVPLLMQGGRIFAIVGYQWPMAYGRSRETQAGVRRDLEELRAAVNRHRQEG